MALEEYRKKRDFGKTPEPSGGKSLGEPIFVVQKHQASHLHYDLRLESEGVLKSWAVPKGPSLNPKDKRLAVMTEDHPIDYAGFEGKIPEGEYGGGTVMVWDNGAVEGDLKEGLQKGHVGFILNGKKLKGEWSLVRLKESKNWLLIKKDDEFASDEKITETKPKSVLSNKTLDEIS
jgi:bifunctional non-homologous end joining protein LigD